MTATFELSVDEWNEEFFLQVKTLFKSGKIRGSVEPEEMDTTEYLLSNPANREHLMRAIENVRRGNVVEVDVDELVQQYGS